MSIAKQTFGKLIRQARRDKEYSQRELAKLVGVNYTYLSKLENDHADYPPSKEVIQSLAHHLDLGQLQLTQLAGRINREDAQVFRELIKRYQEMPVLMRRMNDNPRYAKQIFERDEQELNQLKVEGQIKPEDIQNFKELIKRYPEMSVLISCMRSNPKFAQQIFEQLDRNINREK